MSTSVTEYLKHIRDEAQFLHDSTEGRTVEKFIDDEVLKRACVRAIEIIGEATKKVPEEFLGRNARPSKNRYHPPSLRLFSCRISQPERIFIQRLSLTGF